MIKKSKFSIDSIGSVNNIIVFLSIISFFILIGGFTVKSPPFALALIGGLFIVIITFLNTDLALIIFLFSMLLSPEIPLAKMPERAVVIRLDDILLICMFFAWLAKMALNKQLGFIKKTPINLPLGMYVFIYIFSTLLGIIQGRIQPLQSFFYILKYTEYFIVFFIFANNIRSIKQVRIFSFVLLLTCVFVCIYALSTKGQFVRVTSPFEGKEGEPNTLAGYLVLISAVTISLLIYLKSGAYRFFLLGLLFLIIPTLVLTGSRGGYIGFIIMYLTLIFLTKKRKIILSSLLVIVVLLIAFNPRIIPETITTRLKLTFSGKEEYALLGQRLRLEEAAAQRVIVWGWIFEKWQRYPLFGWGVSGLGLVDNQMALILGEVGLVGMFIFFWLMMSIIRNALRIKNSLKTEQLKGLVIGFVAGLFGLLVHSFAGNIFIIVRIMEPFWFLVALVMALPEVELANA